MIQYPDHLQAPNPARRSPTAAAKTARSPKRNGENSMGLIAQDVEAKYWKAKAMIAAKLPLTVLPGGLVSPTGPVIGVTMVDTPNINGQMDAIEDCLEAILKAIKKLEDRK
jgi:hypothetical protein